MRWNRKGPTCGLDDSVVIVSYPPPFSTTSAFPLSLHVVHLCNRQLASGQQGRHLGYLCNPSFYCVGLCIVAGTVNGQITQPRPSESYTRERRPFILFGFHDASVRGVALPLWIAWLLHVMAWAWHGRGMAEWHVRETDGDGRLGRRRPNGGCREVG